LDQCSELRQVAGSCFKHPNGRPESCGDELTDYEWAAVRPLLPNKPRGVPREDDRRVFNGIFWVLRSYQILLANEKSKPKSRRFTRSPLVRLSLARMDYRKPTSNCSSFPKANNFAVIANELLAKKTREGLAPATLQKVQWLLGFARPTLGARPIATIAAPEILAVLRGVEGRGRHETAKRLRSTLGECFRYAVASGRADTDPTSTLKGALTAPQVCHRAALTEPKAFGGLLRAIRAYEGSPLQLLALAFVRPGELRFADWSEFDLEKAEWTIPPARMKMRRWLSWLRIPLEVPGRDRKLQYVGADAPEPWRTESARRETAPRDSELVMQYWRPEK
jgi:hypothetical protein